MRRFQSNDLLVRFENCADFTSCADCGDWDTGVWPNEERLAPTVLLHRIDLHSEMVDAAASVRPIPFHVDARVHARRDLVQILPVADQCGQDVVHGDVLEFMANNKIVAVAFQKCHRQIAIVMNAARQAVSLDLWRSRDVHAASASDGR